MPKEGGYSNEMVWHLALVSFVFGNLCGVRSVEEGDYAKNN